MKKLIFGLLLLPFLAQASFDHSYKAWDQLLKQYVQYKGPASFVKYKELKENSQGLESVLSDFEKLSLSEYKQFTDPQKIAFLINAYNAFTFKLIITKYPVSSIKKIGGLFGSPWKLKFFTLLGQKRHLDHVEHKILRVDFDEPRIHYALVCAAFSCPRLVREAYQASKLEEQLQAVEKNFLMDASKNYYDVKKKSLHVSSIFKWFKKDFVKNKRYKDLNSYLAERLISDEKERSAYLALKKKPRFLTYSWKLNDAAVYLK